MASVVIGTAAAWGYRNEGKAAYFNVAGGELHMGEEMYEGATEGTVLMLSDTLVYDELVTQLRHGDIVDFGNYRGCGCFCVEPVDASCSDFFLWKTVEEMGYGVPLCFSDAPAGYYKSTELYYVFRDHHFISDKSHPIFLHIQNVYKGIAEDEPTPDWNTQVSPKTKDFPEKYVWFEDNLNGGQGWLSFESFSSQDFFHMAHYKIWGERLKWKSQFNNRVARAVCRIVFGKNFGMPAGVCDMIAERACLPPFGFVRFSPKVSGRKPAKTNTRKKKKLKKLGSDGEEDPDWVPADD